MFHIVLTTRCNLRCRYCYLDTRSGDDLPDEQLEAALGALLDCSSPNTTVSFTGGEPLLAWSTLEHVVTRVESMRSDVGWQISTNGVLLKEDIIRFLEAHRFVVNLSFDGVRPAQTLRGRGTFEILDAWLEPTRSIQTALVQRLNISVTLSPAAVCHLANSVEYFLSKRVRSITIIPAVGDDGWKPLQINELRQQFALVTAIARRHYERFGEEPLALFRNQCWDILATSRAWTCTAPRGNDIALGVDGEAYACVLATRSHQPITTPVLRPAVDALALGRPDSPDFRQRLATLEDRARASGAFDHPELRYSSYRRCADCEYLPRCYACPLAAAHDPTYTDVRRVPDFLCAFNQVTLEARDRFWKA